MATTEIAKSSPSLRDPAAQHVLAIRDEMQRVFDQFEQGSPRWAILFRRGNGDGAIAVPDLDVRENTTSITIEAELRRT